MPLCALLHLVMMATAFYILTAEKCIPKLQRQARRIHHACVPYRWRQKWKWTHQSIKWDPTNCITSWVRKLANYQHRILEQVLNMPYHQGTAASISRQPCRSTRYRQQGKLRRCLRLTMDSLLYVAAASAYQQHPPGESVRLTEALQVCSSVVMSANTTTSGCDPHQTQWDSNSTRIGIDSRASACISDQRADFQGELVPTNKMIKTFGGKMIGGIVRGTL